MGDNGSAPEADHGDGGSGAGLSLDYKKMEEVDLLSPGEFTEFAMEASLLGVVDAGMAVEEDLGEIDLDMESLTFMSSDVSDLLIGDLNKSTIEMVSDLLPTISEPAEGLDELIMLTEQASNNYENISPVSPVINDVSAVTLYCNENMDDLLGLSMISKGSDHLIRFPLHYCVLENNTQYLETLIKQNGLMIDELDTKGYSAAMYAVQKKNHECLLLLINGGADSNKVDGLGNSLIHQAASLGDLVSLLILNRSRPNYKLLNKVGLFPAMIAFQSKNTQVIEYLWDKTKDTQFLLSHMTSFGHTYLHLSSIYNDQNILSKVLQVTPVGPLPLTKKADLSPLHLSIASGILENVKKIYTFYPCQMYLWDTEGDYPIHKARSLEIIEYFKEVDHNILTLKNVKTKKQLIHYLCEEKCMPLISFMLCNFPDCWECEDSKNQKWHMILGHTLSQVVLMSFTKNKNKSGNKCGKY